MWGLAAFRQGPTCIPLWQVMIDPFLYLCHEVMGLAAPKLQHDSMCGVREDECIHRVRLLDRFQIEHRDGGSELSVVPLHHSYEEAASLRCHLPSHDVLPMCWHPLCRYVVYKFEHPLQEVVPQPVW